MTGTPLSATRQYFEHHFDAQTGDQDNTRANAQNGTVSNNYAPYLMAVLKALNWHGNTRTLRDALPHQEEKIGFTDFLNTLSILGYAPKITKVQPGKINADMLPCLFVHKDNKGEGEIFLSVPDHHPSGTAYVFQTQKGAGDIISDKTIAGSDLPWFSKLLRRFKGVFAQVLTASLVINLLALVTPLFMMSVYDKVIGAHSPATLKYLLAGVVLAIGVEFALRFLRSRSLSWFGARIDHIVSNAILERIITLPASFTEQASVAAQLARLKAFESVREFFTGPLFLSFIEFPFTLILLAAIAIIAGPLVLIPFVIAGIYGVLLLAMRERLKALTARMATANGERQTIHIETLGKQETLRYGGGFDAWLNRYEKVSAEASYAGYKYTQAVSFIDTVSQGLVVLGGIAMIYFGVERIWAGHMSMGAMIAVLILTWRTLAPLQMACTALPRLDQVKRNIAQINRLMDLAPERDAYKPAQDTPQFTGAIEFHNVGLRYSKDADPVYAGLSFKAEPGQLIAIAGENSTGKSTTLKLVSGLYQPQAGSIRIDGVDIRQIDQIKLRQNIAYVGQEPEFFTGTLEDNLRLVKPDATYEDIGKAIKLSGLEYWLRTLPEGLETMLGHDGENIPSSLRPQLALARAYLQDSKIMLIDEMPYEFLNSKDGQNFYKYLEKERGKRTVLYITYRQDYIDLADQVIQLHPDTRPHIKENNHD